MHSRFSNVPLHQPSPNNRGHGRLVPLLQEADKVSNLHCVYSMKAAIRQLFLFYFRAALTAYYDQDAPYSCT
eukprot:1158945-Pelagomonas_calceolata.AAC.4